ncbi:MAG: GWxTD domain-containing protein [Melioribacteraceae bacterium]|nr:GWxTD domain-containing protein [Melioribacteraceae bacterium]
MKNLLVCLFLISSVLVAQRSLERKFNPNQPVVFSIHKVPSDSIVAVYISYKVPFRNLVFVKEDDLYSSGLNLLFDILKDDEIIDRKSATSPVKISNYEKTKSAEQYIEGLVKIDLPFGNYTVRPTAKSIISQKIYPLEEIDLQLDKDSMKVLDPIVLDKIKCNGNAALVNFSNGIPYSPDNYSMLFPISDLNLDSIKVAFIQNEKTIFESTLTNPQKINIGYELCEEKLVLSSSGKEKFNLFELTGKTNLLAKEMVEITISGSGFSTKVLKNVVWIDEPIFLRNKERAIQLLEYMISYDEVSDLLSEDEEEYDKVLTDFWKDYDPNKSTAFNELMSVYYSRADYAMKNFSTVNNREGAFTDRGRIYIKLRKPVEIRREYSSINNTLEIWEYEKKQFIFTDKDGLGNFSLMNQ